MTNIQEQYYVDNINDENVQIEFIKEIQKGNILFEKNDESIKSINTVSYYEKMWNSENKLIKLWFEYPGFMSFTYLKFGDIELDESKITYYTQICIAIQDKKFKLYLDKVPSLGVQSFDNFIKPRKKTMIRVLDGGEIKIEEI